MKKIVTSLVFILTFSVYAGYYLNNPKALSKIVATPTEPSQNPNPVQTPTPVTTPTPTTTLPPKTVIPSSPPKQTGQYKNGTYTGDIVDVYYGNVQVQAAISGGKISNVTFLDYPSDRDTSRRISSYAMPALKSEAIQAQSANVDGVSGATATSEGFRQSLSSALSQAKI